MWDLFLVCYFLLFFFLWKDSHWFSPQAQHMRKDGLGCDWRHWDVCNSCQPHPSSRKSCSSLWKLEQQLTREYRAVIWSKRLDKAETIMVSLLAVFVPPWLFNDLIAPVPCDTSNGFWMSRKDQVALLWLVLISPFIFCKALVMSLRTPLSSDVTINGISILSSGVLVDTRSFCASVIQVWLQESCHISFAACKYCSAERHWLSVSHLSEARNNGKEEQERSDVRNSSSHDPSMILLNDGIVLLTANRHAQRRSIRLRTPQYLLDDTVHIAGIVWQGPQRKHHEGVADLIISPKHAICRLWLKEAC